LLADLSPRPGTCEDYQLAGYGIIRKEPQSFGVLSPVATISLKPYLFPFIAVKVMTKADGENRTATASSRGALRTFVHARPKGEPKNAFVSRSSGNACVDKIALAAAKKIRYLPPTQDGNPVVVHTMVKAQF
jgi:TonB family protein